MRPTRGASLAALVLVAVAAPVAAYSLAGDAGTPSPASVSPGNSDLAPGQDKAKPPTDVDSEPIDEAGEPAEASTAGRAHAEAMKEWARCVAEAASGPKAEDAPRPPKLACGDKPMGPGKAKHLAGATDADGEAPGKPREKKPKNERQRGPRG